MTPLGALKKAVDILEKSSCLYCLVGGHAASLYRAQERLTRDVDFALLANPESHSKKIAEQIIKEMGLKPVIGFIPRNSKQSERKTVCMISSSGPEGQAKGIIDILLPELPWVSKAIERAQENRVDLGFASVPVITAEDLIVAKCYALQNAPDRFQDLDDLKEISESIKDLDFDYLASALSELSLSIPKEVRKYFPKFIGQRP